MSFDGRSQVFCVGQKLFQVRHPTLPISEPRVDHVLSLQIPRALLAIHSEVFQGMMELREDGEGTAAEPIELEDDEEEFEAFCEAILSCVSLLLNRDGLTSDMMYGLLYRPYHSCLEEDDPDLEKVLGVLHVAHKYCATVIEGRAHAVTIQLTHPDDIHSHLTERVTALRVVELCHLTECEGALVSAWPVAMETFKRSRGRAAYEGPNSVPVMINFAEKLGRADILGDVYYETMLRGNKFWGGPKLGLTVRQVQTLWVGAAKCAAEGEALLRQWLQVDSLPHECNGRTSYSYGVIGKDCPYTSFGARVAREWDVRRVPSFDLLGRMRAVIDMGTPVLGAPGVGTNCHQNIVSNIWLALEIERAHIWERFQQDEEEADPEPLRLVRGP